MSTEEGYALGAEPLPVRPVQRPAVGRIVHYRQQDTGPCLAAILTEVQPDGEWVFLTVFQPDGMPGYVSHAVPRDGNGWQGHTWHWPERVD